MDYLKILTYDDIQVFIPKDNIASIYVDEEGTFCIYTIHQIDAGHMGDHKIYASKITMISFNEMILGMK